ncbi:MAG: tRNA pseudouridine(38-40) synthase TruA [Actinomycetota bacterium]
MPTYRLDIAYDGSKFYGYAIQPNVPSVQGRLETALAPYTGGVKTYAAGRTDKGVHASQQVVSFTCEEFDTDKALRSLNSLLSPEIAARSLVAVDDGFHARFSATGRAYRYRIRNADVHDPLTAAAVWTYQAPLDVGLMNETARHLVGTHDFSAFCRRHDNRSPVREVLWAQWQRSGEELVFSIGARSFCHQMVRAIVAVSVEVGCGLVDVSEVPGILESLDRANAKGVAPAHGLVLVAVAYDEEPLPSPGWVGTTA